MFVALILLAGEAYIAIMQLLYLAKLFVTQKSDLVEIRMCGPCNDTNMTPILYPLVVRCTIEIHLPSFIFD